MKRWINWMKLAIGFKDDGTINGYKVIKRGTIQWGFAIMNQQLHNDASM
jgi:hypothetical protein